MKTPLRVIIVATLLVGFALLAAKASAMPMFARQIGRKCSFCHTAFPKLNETGRNFKSGGFRFSEEEEWINIKDMKYLPFAIEAEVEGYYNKTKSGGVWSDETDMKIEEVELMGGGAFGKTGRISALAVMGIEQTEGTDGSTEFDSFLGPVFIQVNDIFGDTGSALLNMRAGQWEVALPFLSQTQSLIHNKYFATKNLNVFTPEQRGFELNGSLVGEEETLTSPTHRYSLGLGRSEVNDDNSIREFYATYSLTFLERLSIGTIYRRGEEKDGPVDITNDRFGGAVELEVGPALISGSYFRYDNENNDQLDNYMAEISLFPISDLILSARIDVLDDDILDEAIFWSMALRYDFTESVYAQLEFRHLTDDDLVSGSNTRERKGRLFLVALF